MSSHSPSAAILDARHERKEKANFDWIYNKPDPRDYYTTLWDYDYRLPTYVQRVFGRLASERAERYEQRPTIMDLACSYGVNACLVRYEDVTFEKLAERYASPEFQALTPEQVADADREFFSQRLNPDGPVIYGCDVADNAVAYAERVGLIEKGWSLNLETTEPDAELEAALAETDIVTVSAAIGYLTHRTITKVLSRIPMERRPWFATFALRTAPVDPIACALHDYGLELVTLTSRTVRQRQFVDEAEKTKAIDEVRRRGLVAEGREADGYWHASLHIGVPADEPPLQMMELLET